MIREINYNEAVDLASTYKDRDKITVILFKDEHCPYCAEFIPNVVEKISDKYHSDVDFYLVPDKKGQHFPMQITPIAYVFVPGQCPNEMPLVRPGAAEYAAVDADIKRSIESMKTGLDLNSDTPRF